MVAGGAAATAYGVRYYQREMTPPPQAPAYMGPKGNGYFLNNEPVPAPDPSQQVDSLLNLDAVSEPAWVDREMAAWEERERTQAQGVSNGHDFQRLSYLHFEAGYGLPFWGSPAENAGSLGNGEGIRQGSSDGVAIGVGLGYWASETVRYEMRYQLVTGDFNWTADYRPVGLNLARFESDWYSHQLMPLIYWHPFAFSNSIGVSPFVGIGGGLAFNQLDRIQESSLDPIDSVYARYRRRTRVSPTMMLSTGVQVRITSILWLNVETSASYLGDISSSDRRNFANGNSEAIHPYNFQDQWVGTVTIGLTAYFGG